MEILPYPKRIVIELTPICNLLCSMCPRKYIEIPNGHMTCYLWKRLIDEILETSPEAIIIPFWRGESLLHHDFIGFMNYALDRSLRIHISTNGHLLTKDKADVLTRCEFVTFSIHTMQGYKHAEDFLSLKKGGKPFTQLSFVKGEKTEGMLLKPLVISPVLKGFDSVRLYEEHSMGGVFGQSDVSPASPRIFCQKLVDTIVIAYDGKASRCNHIWKPEDEIDLNNISIEEAWLSSGLQHIRSNHPDERCMPCDQWSGHTCGESWRFLNGSVAHQVFGKREGCYYD